MIIFKSCFLYYTCEMLDIMIGVSIGLVTSVSGNAIYDYLKNENYSKNLIMDSVIWS